MRVNIHYKKTPMVVLHYPYPVFPQIQNTMQFKDINLLDIGNGVGMTGVLFSGKGSNYMVLFPEQLPEEAAQIELVKPTAEEWLTLIEQTDLVNTLCELTDDKNRLVKTVLRKSLRNINQSISWQVFKRDGYKCRYCGADEVLTVDHVDLWENGGATRAENLLTACRSCNKKRSNMSYADWLNSDAYKNRSKNLAPEIKKANEDLLATLPHLETLRTKYQQKR